MLYLDNATTSFPKPPQVYDAVDRFMRTNGASAGRSAHGSAVEAGRIVLSARELVAGLFHVADASRIVFTLNATEALNLALAGLLREGDAVVTSSLEHNSVMRPLRFLADTRRVRVEIVPCDPFGAFDLGRWEAALRGRPRIAVVNHGSNVIGAIAPLAELGALCRRYGVPLLVDAAQTAGIAPIDVERMGIDLLAFSGHKGLFGLQGTGGLYLRDGIDPLPLKFGGTGSNSESDEQPRCMPDRYESGTQNAPGIVSLAAGIAFVNRQGDGAVFAHGARLGEAFLHEARTIRGLRIYGPQAPQRTLPIFSVNCEGRDNGVAAQRLNDEYGIAVRVGLLCAPFAHRTIGAFPAGAIRISFGYFNTEADVERIVSALRSLCATP